MVLANSGPWPTSLAASTDCTTISLMQARIPTIKNGSTAISWDRRLVRTAYSSSTKMKISSTPSRISSMTLEVGVSSNENMVFTWATSRATAAATRMAAMAQYTASSTMLRTRSANR